MKRKKDKNVKNYNLKYELMVEDWQKPMIEKMFKTWNTIYNDLFSYTCRLLHEAQKCKNFEKKSKFAEDYKINIFGAETTIFTEFGFLSMSKKFANTYKNCSYVNSFIIRHLADNIQKGVDKYFSDIETEKINRKKQIDFVSSSLLKKSNGDKFYPFDFDKENGIFSIKYKKKQFINISVYIASNDSLRQFSLNNQIKRMGLKRELIRGEYKYYMVLCFEGEKPYNHNYTLGKGIVGIDPSQQCMHYVTNTEAQTVAIGEKDIIEEYTKKIIKLQRKLERSRRINNPDNFNENGTIKKGKKLHWVKTNNYIKLEKQLSNLDRKLADKKKKFQYDVANELITKGDVFKVEKNNVSAFAKRKKGVHKSKNGKICSNKRFGKSIGNFAPYQFKTILKQKVEERKGKYIEVPASAASTQFDFTNCKFTKHELSERTITLSNGNTHHRDLISAFNIQHYIGGSKKKNISNFDVEKMFEDYEKFCLITR